MTTPEVILAFAVAICVIDYVLAMTQGRCVIPGLKCSACRTRSSQ